MDRARGWDTHYLSRALERRGLCLQQGRAPTDYRTVSEAGLQSLVSCRAGGTAAQCRGGAPQPQFSGIDAAEFEVRQVSLITTG